MYRTIVWIGCLTLVACGGLDEGTYDVDLTMNTDGCGFDFGTSRTEWTFSDRGDGKWRIKFEDAGGIDGKEKGGGIEFHDTAEISNDDIECLGTMGTELDIAPNGSTFEGALVFNITTHGCVDPANDGETCESSYDVSGEKQD